MRKTTYFIVTLAVGLIVTLFSIAIDTSTLAAKEKGLGPRSTATNSLAFFTPPPQNAHFIWVPIEGDQSRPGFKRVVGGTHSDGTTMYICRVSGFVPGKIYNNSCHYSAAGQENVIAIKYEVLLSDVESEWRSFDNLKRSEIKRNAVIAGIDPNTKDSMYICRKKMGDDGRHPGKYSYKNNLCYIPWGNQEIYYSKGFSILFPSQ